MALVQYSGGESTMADAIPLNTIPEELQTRIASFADPHDLLALRTTCRSLARASHEAFVKRFFERRVHVFTVYSLQVLLAITKDPVFGKRIKEVVLVAVLPDRSTDRTVKLRLRCLDDREIAMRCLYLAKVFQSLMHRGCIPALRLSTEQSDIEDCFGIQQICHEYREICQVTADTVIRFQASMDGDAFVRDVLTTVAASECPIKALSFSVHDLSAAAFNFVTALLDSSKRAFGILRRLEIVSDLSDLCIAIVDQDPGYQLPELLESATALQEVQLDGQNKGILYSFERFFDQLTNCPIKSLELRNLDLANDSAHESVLEYCLCKRGALLERLVIDNVTVDEPNMWPRLAKCMLQDLRHLTALRFTELWSSDYAGSPRTLWSHSASVKGDYQGRDAVKEVLERMSALVVVDEDV